MNKEYFQKNQKIVFIGDSVTKQGHFIKTIETFLQKEKPELGLRLVNVGLNSETVSGLSEPIHDPPRPFLFDRLDAILEKEKPDVVFFCYGINDGIYHPYTDANFQKYKNGVQLFLEKMEKSGIPIILLTPPPFAIKENAKEILKSNGDTNYSWANPYHDYDADVILKFRNYILSIDHPLVKSIIDIYQPLNDQKEVAYGDDPIHPNIQGHQLIGQTIIDALF